MDVHLSHHNLEERKSQKEDLTRARPPLYFLVLMLIHEPIANHEYPRQKWQLLPVKGKLCSVDSVWHAICAHGDHHELNDDPREHRADVLILNVEEEDAHGNEHKRCKRTNKKC